MWSFRLSKFSFLFWLGVVFVISLPAIFPLFHPGIFVSDDAEWMIIRSSAFHEAFRDGQIPTRFLGRLNQNYGYPVSHFLYPLYLYVAEPIHLLGFGFVTTIKIIFGLSLFSSTTFIFLWLRKLFNSLAASVGAIVSLYIPYHLFTTYSRGSVGEVLALSFVPLILYGFETRNKILCAFGIGPLLLSHNTLSILFLPFLFFYMTLCTYDKETEKINLRSFRGVFELGMGLSAFFWIPALVDLSSTHFSSTVISNWSEYFADLSLLGVVTVVLFILSISLLVSRSIRELFVPQIHEHHLVLFAYMILVGTGVIFLTLPVSAHVWEFFPSALIQFPYRLLSFLIIITAFLSSFLTYYIKGKMRYLISGVLLFLVLLSYPANIPTEYTLKPEEFYTTNMDTTTTHQEYMPKWVSQTPVVKPDQVIVASSGTVENQSITNDRISFLSSGVDGRLITINKLYFPGWEASSNGIRLPLTYHNPHGVMQLYLTPGKHDVSLVFTETPIRLFADSITLISFLTLMILGIRDLRKSNTV